MELIATQVTTGGDAITSYDLTDANGNYRLSALAPGNYVVTAYSFAEDYLSESWNNARGTPPTEVTVTDATDTPGINFALVRGGSISGRVAADQGGAGLPSQIVTVSGLSPPTSFEFGVALTDSSGYFIVHGLTAGPYRVRVDPTLNGSYLSEFYNDAPTQGTATPVVVTIGATTTGIDFGLATGGSIRGKITRKDTGEPLEGISVLASGEPGLPSGFAETDTVGNYEIRGLRTGLYRVLAIDLFTYYPDTQDPDSAAFVSVTEGQQVGNINISGTFVDCSLPPEAVGQITGRVRDAITLDGMADVEVIAYSTEETGIGSGSTTLPNGDYTLECLLPGTYIVVAYLPDSPYLPEWYDEKSDSVSANAVTVTVTAGAAAPSSGAGETPNINFTLSRGGSIHGRVTDNVSSSGIPFAEVRLSAVGTRDVLLSSTETDMAGVYYYRVTNRWMDRTAKLTLLQ